jgi:hypothetical protein
VLFSQALTFTEKKLDKLKSGNFLPLPALFAVSNAYLFALLQALSIGVRRLPVRALYTCLCLLKIAGQLPNPEYVPAFDRTKR